MAVPKDHCFFRDLYCCQKKKEKLQNASEARINTIITCSKQLDDTYNETLTSFLEEHPIDPIIRVHKSCVSRYTSPTNVKAHIAHLRKAQGTSDDIEHTPPKRLRSIEAFDFQKHCLFCPTVSDCLLFEEHDQRSRQTDRTPAFLIRSLVHRDGVDYKQYVLDTCSQRNDQLGDTVRARVSAAVGDLHAADARYHVKCKATFFNSRSIHYASVEHKHDMDQAFVSVCNAMEENMKKLWSSIELFSLYTEEGGNRCCQKTLFKNIQTHHGDRVLVMSSPGYSNLIGFKTHMTKSLHLLKTTDDDLDYCIERVATTIKNECTNLKKKRDIYNINIDKDLARDSVAPTSSVLLSKISSKLDNDSLTMLLIGNMLTSVVCSQATDLQVALGIFLRRNHIAISELSKYSVCCSYDEVKLFRYSAAVHVSNHCNEASMFSGDSLRHCIVDNFDAEISSPNCKSCVHCLAMILAQVQIPESDSIDGSVKRKTIKRQPFCDKAKPIQYEIEHEQYDGPKKPPMPLNQSLFQVPPLQFLSTQIITVQRAQENDLAFLYDINHTHDCPEYNGYNTKLCREAGMASKPKSTVAFMPLIDLPPAHHDTILTALIKGLSLMKDRENEYLVFTADQQLYKIVIDIMFHKPSFFNTVIPVLGGMHMLMNFIHAISTIMSGSGLKEILGSSFSSVDKMLSGKKYPQNFRALRMLVGELLRSVVQEKQFTSFKSLIQCLDQRASQSQTARMWIDNLVKATIIMMNFSRAGHEADTSLHIFAAEAMLPYFRFAGCHNYSRYGSFYVHHIKSLPSDTLKKILHEDFFMRHIPGIYNSLWTDMFIESTYMRLGHGPAGVVGLATNYDQMTKWALSFALCGEVSQSIRALSTNQDQTDILHKEEKAARIKSDQNDRRSLRSMLDTCIHPLECGDHADGALMNVVTGEIAHPESNVADALQLGKQALSLFRTSWPSSFYEPLTKIIIPMDSKKKHVALGEHRIFDQELIYARVIGLQASNRETINMKDVLKFELAAYPPSMFNSEGQMKTPNAKYVLKQSLQHTISERNCHVDVVVWDVSAVLWATAWPSGKLQRLIDNFKARVNYVLQTADLVLCFDRYNPTSIKAFTRTQRSRASRVHNLHPDRDIPGKDVCLTNTQNKIQLNALITESLIKPDFATHATTHHSLTIAGVCNSPLEITNGLKIERHDLSSSHEEADIIIAQHAIATSLLDKAVHVVCDDTDVLALLIHFYHSHCKGSTMIMSSPIKDRAVIDIKATTAAHSDIAPDILAIHGLSGADTVSSLYGIGKATVVKIAKQGKLSLNSIGNIKAEMETVKTQATSFICAAYGASVKSCTSMTECRVKLWGLKTGITSSKLCSLPPTDAAFLQHVLRAHLQVAIWKSALHESPPDIDPTKYGWDKDHQGNLIPRTVAPGTLDAPPEILHLIRCQCKTSECRTAACNCANIGCTVFCLCGGGDLCKNPHTRARTDGNDDDDDDLQCTDNGDGV